MKRLAVILGAMMALSLAGQAAAAEFEFHGDLNNRFMIYTDQAGVYSGAETISKNPVSDDTIDETWGDIKYRLWTEASTNDGKVKGVYAIELGAVRFGNDGKGGAFSGDGVNIETRWAYTDFALPAANESRVRIGLMPYSLNPFLWNETAMGVQLYGDAQGLGYSLAWIRGREFYNDNSDDNIFEDIDALSARVDLKPAETTKLGLFALYLRADAEGDEDDDDPIDFTDNISYQIKRFGASSFDIYNVGTDGSFTTPTGFGNAFVNWDLIYQGGSIDTPDAGDVSAFLAHADLGANVDRLRLTYTFWYASGDDDATDGDVENFMSVDVDRTDSVVLMEGGYTDDNYFTEAPHILDKGLILNKIAADYKATEKLAFGGALLYLMTAEDLANGEDTLGTEIDAYVSYKLYPNVEMALNGGYLIADDGMANFGADEDIFRSTARVRYSF